MRNLQATKKHTHTNQRQRHSFFLDKLQIFNAKQFKATQFKRYHSIKSNQISMQ